MVYPEYREHYLPGLTPRQLKDAQKEPGALVISPTGAIEQHGPHLPVGTDSIAAHAWIALLLDRLSPAEKSRVWIGPSLSLGKSNEHTGFPGTLSLSARSLRLQTLALAGCVRKLGFNKLFLLNGHGGNVSVLRYSLEEASHQLGMTCGLLSPGWQAPVSPREQRYGIHAGEVETSWLLHFCPEFVNLERADTCWIGPEEEDGETLLRPEFAPVTYSWITADIAATGTMGDATIASAEKGAAWVEEVATAYAEAVRKLLTEGSP